MNVRQKILELSKTGPVRVGDLLAMGYSRSTAGDALAMLQKQGKLFKRGHAKATFYTNDPTTPDTPVVHPGQRSRSFVEPLPDLPDDILLMMGYTKHPVNTRHARFVGGVL